MRIDSFVAFVTNMRHVDCNAAALLLGRFVDCVERYISAEMRASVSSNNQRAYFVALFFDASVFVIAAVNVVLP